ncbi:hypothetical protein [Microbacterium kyungheense]|uniref:Uncharacterized protein n=1 Tax=Microbacterium kyungheense TaxID=1263636 RepID=A0A543EQ79_9MICO|nr:hypothetical protein [Microbacterium kyungheense]TQM23672.1 hypothetical protein FB391_3062 [Microbacterium kyungheense]
MSGWWRSNAVALGALVLLVPATYAAMSWNEWSTVLENSASKAVALPPGEEIPYAGATVGPASAEFTELPDAPAHTRVVTVTLHIDPGDQSFSCTVPQLREADGHRRQWDARDDLGREWDPDIHTFCDSEAEGPYDLTLDYLVPDDASGPFVVELESVAGRPEFVSAVVEP